MESSRSSQRSVIDYLYVILTALIYGIIFFFRASFGPITDVLENEFNTTSSGIGILSSSYFMTYVFVQIPWGLFLQMFPCELSLIIAAFSSSILSLAFPFSQTVAYGSIIRGLSGATSAQMWITGITLGGQKFGNNYVSICGAINLLSGALHVFIGNLIQAQLYEKYNKWKETYYFIAILSFIYGSLCLFCVCCERKNILFRRLSTSISKQEIDNIQNLTICKQLKKNMKQSIIMYQNWLLGAFGFCCGVIYFGTLLLWLVPYLMVKFDYTRSLATIIVGITLLTSGIASIGCGECSRRTKRRKIFLIISSFLFVSFVLLIYLPDMPLSVVIILNVLTGISVGCFPLIFTLTREYNWYFGNAETATGFVNTVTLCSAFFGQYTIGALLDLHYEKRGDDATVNIDGNREYIVSDYNFAFMIVPICVGCAIVLSLLLKETYGINTEYDGNKNESNKCKESESEQTCKTDVTADLHAI